MSEPIESPLAQASFWQLPLAERMARFADIREQGPFVPVEFENPMQGLRERFYAVTRYDEVVEISRRSQDFCSGKGAVSIPDMPVEALDFFGSFINMDDPRHARQRGIVARSFTPRQLQGVLDSVETICNEVIDGFCAQGEVDLVEVMSQPFPLLVICDMMGIPRSEFQTVLDATNVILGGGDPEYIGDRDVMTAIFEAGMQLTALMNDLAEQRRAAPTDDLTSKLVHNDLGEDMLAPQEIAPFFILLAVAGNDTTRTGISHGMNLLSQNPDQRRIWQDDLETVTPTAVEEIVRVASPVTFMRRTVTHDLTLSGQDFVEGDKVVLFYGAANRDPRQFEDPEAFDVRRDPNPHVGFGGPGPHFCLGAHLARRELSVVFRQLLTRLPDIEVSGEVVPLDALGIPLVGGIKRLPVRFTPTAPLGRRPQRDVEPLRWIETEEVHMTQVAGGTSEGVFENVRGVGDALNVRRVFGEPYELDGCTVIPVAKVAGGAGGGGGEGNKQGESGTGFGTGFGLQARPVGVYQVRGAEVIWKPALDVTRLAKGGQVLAGLLAVCVTLIAIARRPRYGP
jgi:methyl-branched lipid omega-hydroxylase